MSTLDHMLEPKAVRRLEVITGAGGRRRFPDEEKARILEETFAPGAVVSAVARLHGLTPQQLFTWRRQARKRSKVEPASFVPAVVEAVVTAPIGEAGPGCVPGRRMAVRGPSKLRSPA